MQETFNPILSQEDVRGWSLTRDIPAPAPNTVLVLSRSGYELLVISHTEKPISFSRFKFGGYNSLYKIDVGQHVLKIDCSLPSKTAGFDFPTTVEITCSVFEPQTIVRAGTQDVASVLKARLINEMKQISRDYDLQENAMAEKDINRSVRRRVVDERCFDDLGLRIPQLVASLQIDSSAIGSIKQIKLDELERMRASANQEHYEKLLRGGETSLLAAYLAQNPENIASLIARLDQQKQLASVSNMELLKIMIQEDAIEGSQLDETGRRVLQRLMGLTPKAVLEDNTAKQNPSPLSDEDNSDDDLLDNVPS
jgi:hypothetical protein